MARSRGLGDVYKRQHQGITTFYKLAIFYAMR
jgi:hypothetical protein